MDVDETDVGDGLSVVELTVALDIYPEVVLLLKGSVMVTVTIEVAATEVSTAVVLVPAAGAVS